MDTKSALCSKLDSDHLATLAEGLSAGYGYVAAIMASSPVLSNFWPGRGLHGHLVDPCVQYGIEAAARRRQTFHTEIAGNSALNHYHARFLAKGSLCITTHFTGRDADRTFARKAVNRGELAARCDDLFGSSVEATIPVDGALYAHLLHGGYLSPVSAFLAIPDRSQSYPLAPWALPLTDLVTVDVEAVAEKMSFKVKEMTAVAEKVRGTR